MNTTEKNKMVVVSVRAPLAAGMVKSDMSNFEIDAFLKDEYMGTISVWYTSVRGTESVKVGFHCSEGTFTSLLKSTMAGYCDQNYDSLSDMGSGGGNYSNAIYCGSQNSWDLIYTTPCLSSFRCAAG
jgi:hypothetical protein